MIHQEVLVKNNHNLRHRKKRISKRKLHMVQVSKILDQFHFEFVELGVRAFAHRNKIDINSITGSGKGGRVTKEDVIKAMEG